MITRFPEIYVPSREIILPRRGVLRPRPPEYGGIGAIAANRRRSGGGGGGPDITTGLIGWWKLDDGSGTTAVDSGSGGNNGVLTNGPTWNGSGHIGTNCVSFDGSDDNIVASLSSISAYPFTLAAWVNCSVGGGIISWVLPSSNVVYYALTFHGAGYPDLQCRSSGPDEDAYLDTSVGPFLGSWTHMTAVFESSTSRKVYVNGSYLFTATVSIPFVAANTIAIGAVMRSAAYGYITGLVDDARVYNRALSATEVSALYAYT